MTHATTRFTHAMNAGGFFASAEGASPITPRYPVLLVK